MMLLCTCSPLRGRDACCDEGSDGIEPEVIDPWSTEKDPQLYIVIWGLGEPDRMGRSYAYFTGYPP